MAKRYKPFRRSVKSYYYSWRLYLLSDFETVKPHFISFLQEQSRLATMVNRKQEKRIMLRLAKKFHRDVKNGKFSQVKK